jgi:hypothetical protein
VAKPAMVLLSGATNVLMPHIGEEKHAHAATTGYNVDTEWYTDFGATDYITFELDKLTIKEKYGGLDQVHTANGLGMPISHIGQFTIHTHDRDLILKNILHVPNAFKNLVSIYKFTYDNNVFFEFHHWYFLLKDRDTRKPLLHENGLYPLPLTAWYSKPPNKSALVVIKPSMVRWHYRLGHASSPIVQ